MHPRLVLRCQARQERLEILLVRVEPADSEPPHRQRLDVERLVPEGVGDLEELVVVADEGPVEDGVVADEDGPVGGSAQARPDEPAEVPHRPIRRDPISLETLARDAVHGHSTRVEAWSDRLELDVETLLSRTEETGGPADGDHADRHEVVQPGNRA